MAITGTKAFTSEVLTSSDVNRYLMRGVKVYDTTTDRDNSYGGAGEPVLEEGETCYITATDELQSYGGTALGWVKMGPTTVPTPAITATAVGWIATAQSTSSTSYTDLATVGPSVTITTGTEAIIYLGSVSTYDTSANGRMAFAVSGATTVAASDSLSVSSANTFNGRGMVGLKITGLTAGSNTFTAKYKTSAGNVTHSNRFLQVVVLP